MPHQPESNRMNGAESLVATLLNAGIDTCFGNPGTSEMHFVAALDKFTRMRCVLGLFEGVVTGAADGYARMLDKPAVTLLHLGPGLGNGLANLHNARKAHSPVVNVVGEHTTWHIQHDAPLTADIEGIARPVSHWVHTCQSAAQVANDAARAIQASMQPPGQIATLVLPADTAWDSAESAAEVLPPALPRAPSAEAVERVAQLLRCDHRALLLLGGKALRESELALVSAIAAKTGVAVLAQTANARMQRGGGRMPVERVPFPVDQALSVLQGYTDIVLVHARDPVAFFAYPERPSRLAAEGCRLHRLADNDEDASLALQWLAEAVGARKVPEHQLAPPPPVPAHELLTPDAIAATLALTLPENAIVADESVTTGRSFFTPTASSPPHDWLNNTGGSIGLGLPLATGAAVACPGRRVLCLSGDGSAMYTIQSLWTQARENLDVTTVIFANHDYRILKGELRRVGVTQPGRSAIDMLDLDRPHLDWVSMAGGMGVPATRVNTNGELDRALRASFAGAGPQLIEATITPR